MSAGAATRSSVPALERRKDMMNLLKIVPFALAFGLLSDASAQESQWSIDQPVATIPKTPLQGRIFGKEFKLKSATIGKVALTLSSTGEPWPDGELIIFIGHLRQIPFGSVRRVLAFRAHP